MNVRQRLAAIAGLRRWLAAGVGIKRWLAVVFVGELGLAFGGAFALRQLYRDGTFAGPLEGVLYLVTLQFLPYVLRGLLLAALGIAIFSYGSYRVLQVLMGPYRSDADAQPLVELIYQKRFLARGPRIAVLGGGHGLATMLRGLKEHTSNLTAIVTVADDGGSSGKLRDQLGVPAVGDIRNCLVALADAEPLMSELFQYRFPGEEAPTSLAGHAIGNLLIAAMTAVEQGDFEEGVRRMNRVLAVRGQVVPATATPVVLHAALRDGTLVDGQSRIARTTGIDRVWLSPDDVRACEDALEAIAEADVIVIGPGSLFTSILPSLLLADIREALAASPALRIYVCNVATQTGETEAFDLADHVEALERHTAAGIVDIVLANNRTTASALSTGRRESVRLRWPPVGPRPARLVLDDIVDPASPIHHDPERLAAAILRIAEREGAARRRNGVART
ncbi:MAG: gluconeogenesis factor YvcK family protein, partial [Candidatus Limnocylindrales bacterium]